MIGAIYFLTLYIAEALLTSFVHFFNTIVTIEGVPDLNDFFKPNNLTVYQKSNIEAN